MRTCHVRIGKANASESPAKYRKLINRLQNREISVFSGQAWEEPDYCPSGVRYIGGASPIQAFVWNMGTCRLDGSKKSRRVKQAPKQVCSELRRNELKWRQPQERNTDARHRGGPIRSVAMKPCNGGEAKGSDYSVFLSGQPGGRSQWARQSHMKFPK